MTVRDLTGSSGSRMAAVLYLGVPVLAGGDTALAGLGGFSVDVPSDPFTVTALVRQGPPGLNPWPTFGEQVAVLPPGIHTLVIYVSTNLGLYSEWVPANPVDRACVRFLTVSEGRRTEVLVEGVPLWQPPGLPGAPVCLPMPLVSPAPG